MHERQQACEGQIDIANRMHRILFFSPSPRALRMRTTIEVTERHATLRGDPRVRIGRSDAQGEKRGREGGELLTSRVSYPRSVRLEGRVGLTMSTVVVAMNGIQN